MPRKSVIKRKPAQVRALIDRLIREDQLTLDEMRDYIQEKFPKEPPPSRSALHRYQLAQKSVTDRIRTQDVIARAMVSELGQNPDERAGALLTQCVTTAMTHVALRMNESDETTIEDVRKLARAAKDTIAARASSLKERQAIQKEAREAALRDAASRVEAAAQARGLSAEDASFWRQQVLMGM